MHYIHFFAKIMLVYWPLVLAVLSICLLIYVVIQPLSFKIEHVEVNIFTYLGALIFVSFYIFLFLALRWLQLNKEINLSNIPLAINQFINHYNHTSPFLKILVTLLLILGILVWIFIFIKLRSYLSYQLWKVYFYHGYKHNKITDYTFTQHKIVKYFNDKLSYYWICYKISLFGMETSEYYKWISLAKWFNRGNHILMLIRILAIVFIFVFIFWDCYFHNYSLVYTKYYMLFYMVFSLWYKVSTFFDVDAINLIVAQTIFELVYRGPTVIYINISEKDIEFLENYLKNFKGYFDNNTFADFIWSEPPLIYYHRFILTKVDKILEVTETGFNPIPYFQVYQNNYTKRYCPASWIKTDTKRPWKKYSDAELF